MQINALGLDIVGIAAGQLLCNPGGIFKARQLDVSRHERRRERCRVGISLHPLSQYSCSVVELPGSSVSRGQIECEILIELGVGELGDDGLIVACVEKDFGDSIQRHLGVGVDPERCLPLDESLLAAAQSS